MKLELKEESWKNLFHCIQKSKIKSEGNFWAALQYLERQFEKEMDKE